MAKAGKRRTKPSDAIARYLLKHARYRAKRDGLPFNLEASDIIIPKRCPIFGKLLHTSKGRATDWSPSLDRIIPEMGYTKGNVIVVSLRVNTIKSNATIGELMAIAAFYRRKLNTLLD